MRTCCVLWHAPGAVVPPNLAASLTARPVDVVSCDNPYSTLASVCAAAHCDSARPILLVIIEPATLPLAPRVLVLAEHFVPHAARWAYEAAAEVKLRAVTTTMLANLHRAPPVPVPAVVTRAMGPTPAVPSPAANGTHGGMGKSIPAIRDMPAQKAPTSPPKDDFPLSLGLTTEELAMLLADGPKDTGGGGTAGATGPAPGGAATPGAQHR